MTGAGAPTKADRLKAALRENLKRRKAQARSRQAADKLQGDDAVEPNASAERRGE
jgi:UDP:flavonoid glycosyltransferase YjiC (YdhE family)